MNYEEMTYEYILDRMLTRVIEKYPNLDDREGSIIYNALAPAAIELTIMYSQLDNVLKQSFVPTATRDYKLLGCEQIGIDTSIFEAHAGTFKGEFDVEVEIGSRWNCDLYNYVIQEFLGMNGEYYTYSMLCETDGTAPNNTTGDLTAITYIPDGLTYSKLTECLIEGENEVSDEGINEAYEEHINNSVGDGNVDQYKLWCNEYDGIGNSKVFPLWNGNNTVKVSILSASNKAASDELIAEFQNYLDPGVTGMGDGVAPIGAFVTVTTATEKAINVSLNITRKDGYSDVEDSVKQTINQYFSEIAYNKSVVSYFTLASRILEVEGVDNITDLSLNSLSADVTLTDEEIPVLGSYTDLGA